MDHLKTQIPKEVHEILTKANINSLTPFLTHNSDRLVLITNLSLEVVEDVIQKAAKIVHKHMFTPVSKVPKWVRISTGCLPIDEITRNGVPANGITEIFGSSGVGKTQFCLQLALRVQLPPKSGGLSKGAIYICTEDLFPSKRLNEMAMLLEKKYKDTSSRFEDNIFLKHVADFKQLRNCIFQEVPKIVKTKPIALIVIDSIAGAFRSENLDVNYKNRHQDFVEFVSKLLQLSAQFQIAIVCTNQVTDVIQTGKTEPCLGLSWSNLVTCRFSISRISGGVTREFKVVFAPDLPNKSCKFQICRDGLAAVSNF